MLQRHNQRIWSSDVLDARKEVGSFRRRQRGSSNLGQQCALLCLSEIIEHLLAVHSIQQSLHCVASVSDAVEIHGDGSENGMREPRRARCQKRLEINGLGQNKQYRSFTPGRRSHYRHPCETDTTSTKTAMASPTLLRVCRRYRHLVGIWIKTPVI